MLQEAPPSPSAALRIVLPCGTALEVAGPDNGWLRVRTSEFGEGWVKSEFVDLTGETSEVRGGGFHAADDQRAAGDAGGFADVSVGKAVGG